MSENNSPLYVAGLTVDGVPVLAGLFKMHDQQGFPLEASVGECIARGCAPGFGDFALEARRAGWDWDKIERSITSAIRENGMPAWRKPVIDLLRKIAKAGR